SQPRRGRALGVALRAKVHLTQRGRRDMISTEIYPRHSPSALNLFAACPSMFVLERILGIKQAVGVPAHRGVAVEKGVALGLLDPYMPISQCIIAAYTEYDTLSALTPDPRREKYRASIADMVTAAVGELRAYGVPTGTQGFIEWRPDELLLPIVGYYDFRWEQHGILADLKTTEKMPSQIKIPHARQVALYATSDNVDARLIYVTPKKIEPYRLENIRRHREALKQIARRVENFLSLSDDPDFYKTIVVPDLDSFYWASPISRQLAFEHWQI